MDNECPQLKGFPGSTESLVKKCESFRLGSARFFTGSLTVLYTLSLPPPCLPCRRAAWRSQWPPKEASRADPRRFQRAKAKIPMLPRKPKQRWVSPSTLGIPQTLPRQSRPMHSFQPFLRSTRGQTYLGPRVDTSDSTLGAYRAQEVHDCLHRCKEHLSIWA